MRDFKEGLVSVCITDWSCYGNAHVLSFPVNEGSFNVRHTAFVTQHNMQIIFICAHVCCVENHSCKYKYKHVNT